MRLQRPFVKLPIRFCGETLRAEVAALPKSAWVPHATGFPGNDAVRLVTPGGQPTDAFEGPMAPTPNLQLCPYIVQVMARLGGVWGRSRLMGLAPGAEVPPHVDSHYHWRTHLRIHVPVITNPGVEFTCGGETVHMAPGECWVFDSFRWHEVHNRGAEKRVHLVLDTVVTERLWDLIDSAQSGSAGEPEFVAPGQKPASALMFEQVNAPRIMSPWEIRCHLAFVEGELVPHPKAAAALKRLDRFADSWAALWARFGAADQALPAYGQLIARARQELASLGGREILLKNELDLSFVIEQLVFVVAAAPRAEGNVTANVSSAAQRLAS